MCGICGFVGFKNSNLLQKMTAILAHRGPDGSGFYSDGHVSLGHRRLAIIDLSFGGHQPFFSEDKKKILICNGEIYNYQTLKEKLIKKGHRFFGQSDNEIILHGFEEWGLGVVNKLVGMFAFAIWDKGKKKLILGRDHLGIKPLYYTLVQPLSFDQSTGGGKVIGSNNKLVFASELKAILAWKGLKKEIDPLAIDYYLSLRYLPGERTMFKGMKRLPPGSLLVFKNGKVKIVEYWQPSTEQNLASQDNVLRSYLEESVKSQMVADVPVGTYLSGGLDSSIITALAQKKAQAPLKTFSLGFGGKTDESIKAKRVARILHTAHQPFKMRQADFNFLPKIVSLFDEPIGDPIILPLYLLAKSARQQVKVVLTGDGADEIFGGYIHYWGIYGKERLKKIFPTSMMVLGAKIIPSKLVNRLFPYPASIGAKGKQRLVKFLQAKSLPDNFLAFASLFSQEEKKQLYTADFLKGLKQQKSISQEIKEEFAGTRGNILTKLITRDIKYWLPDYILLMADRLSMACGLEIRVPYLDHRLVEFSLAVPAEEKVKWFKNKIILRKTAAKILPREVLDQPKQAFFVPLEQFLGQEMKELINQTLNKKVIERRGLFNFDYIKKLKEEFAESPLLVGKQLMALIILELWFRKYVDEQF